MTRHHSKARLPQMPVDETAPSLQARRLFLGVERPTLLVTKATLNPTKIVRPARRAVLRPQLIGALQHQTHYFFDFVQAGCPVVKPRAAPVIAHARPAPRETRIAFFVVPGRFKGRLPSRFIRVRFLPQRELAHDFQVRVEPNAASIGARQGQSRFARCRVQRRVRQSQPDSALDGSRKRQHFPRRMLGHFPLHRHFLTGAWMPRCQPQFAIDAHPQQICETVEAHPAKRHLASCSAPFQFKQRVGGCFERRVTSRWEVMGFKTKIQSASSLSTSSGAALSCNHSPSLGASGNESTKVARGGEVGSCLDTRHNGPQKSLPFDFDFNGQEVQSRETGETRR